MNNYLITKNTAFNQNKLELVGGKALGLWKFNKLNTPKWFVLTTALFDKIYADDLIQINNALINNDFKELEQIIMLKKFPKNITSMILKKINPSLKYAIRSSAVDEDGKEFSFAGVMDSFLNITKPSIITYIKRCYLSAFSPLAIKYRKTNNLKLTNIKMAVIVQEMVDAEIAGVANTINPVTNNPDEFLISVVEGLGDALVSGEKESIDYIVNGSIIKGDNPLLSHKMIKKIVKLCYQVLQSSITFQDIEFAIKNNKVYFLQARAITTYQHINITNKRVVYDNSNIIESYSGVTTPLTFSFAKEVYEKVYTQTLKVGKVNDKLMNRLKPYLEDMIRFHENKIYYNLNSWYKLTSIFPNRQNNLNYMENMMGVKTKMTKVENIKMSLFDLIKVGIILIKKLNQMPKLSTKFLEKFNNVVTPYLANEFEGYTSQQLIELYHEIEVNIVDDFTTPIINDLGAMMYYGRLTKMVKKLGFEDPDGFISNAVSKQGEVVSTMSAPLYQNIILVIRNDEEILNDFKCMSPQALYQKYHNDSPLSNSISEYIKMFGPRVMDELKLETETLYENPIFLYEMLQNSIKNNLTIKTYQTENISYDFIPKSKQLKLKRLIKKTKYFIKNREELRLRRTYLYSVIRKIYLRIGKNFETENIIENYRDIFYLKKDEISMIINGEINKIRNPKQSIIKRKKAYEENKTKPVYNRIVLYGNQALNVYTDVTSTQTLKGIPSGAGVVDGRVKLVTDPKNAIINNEIMLAMRTDPGWIMLFPMCKGLIVERGSILSHSAVVAREMGIPAVVGVLGATSIIKDGDYVHLDGIKGEVIIDDAKKI